MTYEEYKEVLKNGERVDWYGEMVPVVLLTGRVRSIANMVISHISEMEDTLSEYPVGKSRTSRKRSIERSWENVRTLPYTQNGLIYDFFMIKYKRIMEELEKEGSKPPKPIKKVTSKREKSKKLTEEKPTRVKNTQVETKPKKEKVKEVQEKVEKPEEQPKPKVKGRRTKNSKLIFGK